MKKIIISLRNNLIILVGLTFGVDVLLDALDIQLPIILVLIWLGFLMTLVVWSGIEFAKKKQNKL